MQEEGAIEFVPLQTALDKSWEGVKVTKHQSKLFFRYLGELARTAQTAPGRLPRLPRTAVTVQWTARSRRSMVGNQKARRTWQHFGRYEAQLWARWAPTLGSSLTRLSRPCVGTRASLAQSARSWAASSPPKSSRPFRYVGTACILPISRNATRLEYLGPP